MATKTWETTKTIYCPRLKENIALDTLLIYPSEHLPEQLPRILGHRCSAGLVCNLLEKPGCVWSGNTPSYNPFIEGIVA